MLYTRKHKLKKRNRTKTLTKNSNTLNYKIRKNNDSLLSMIPIWCLNEWVRGSTPGIPDEGQTPIILITTVFVNVSSETYLYKSKGNT